MRSWVFLLHFYQPPTQSLSLTESILQTCYLPLLNLLLNNPQAHFTINLSASLILQLESLPNHDFFPKLHTLLEREQIELLQSVFFHPLLPLTPHPVILRQWAENTEIIEKFCRTKPIKGFFPPELAIDPKTLALILSQADFTILDESSLNPDFSLQSIPKNLLYSLENKHLFVSSRCLSETIRSYPTELSASRLATFISSATPENQLLVSLSDSELFGHHYRERLHFLSDLIALPDLKFLKATTALKKFSAPKISLSKFQSSTWQTTPADPFSLWLSPKNKLQQDYYALADLAYEAIEKSTPADPNSHYIHSAEHHYDQGISSCHPYWLSHYPWWHPDMVEQGAKNLVKSIRTLPVDHQFKNKAESLYHSLMLAIWNYHWSDQIHEEIKSFDRNRTPFLGQLPQL